MIPKIEFKICGQGNNAAAYKACETFIEEWQKRLSIQDWDIGLSFLSASEVTKEMGSNEYNAYCSRTSQNKTAMININCESSQVNDDIERTLIHELLHIVFDEYQTVTEAAIGDDTYALKIIKLKMEQTVESLAKSFSAFVNSEG